MQKISEIHSRHPFNRHVKQAGTAILVSRHNSHRITHLCLMEFPTFINLTNPFRI